MIKASDQQIIFEELLIESLDNKPETLLDRDRQQQETRQVNKILKTNDDIQYKTPETDKWIHAKVLGQEKQPVRTETGITSLRKQVKRKRASIGIKLNGNL
ncbi:hypothetical protein DPMN_117657 [Dreissena polymorpha]|uniref:Uncharacterized protein n=1 Tax=Dreissena polymorpha TaxID=45954 RepID=A0A9D4GIR8_DREPO|nr:hypothetical protein DPMN_117657 [Dreissena polymorpha]